MDTLKEIVSFLGAVVGFFTALVTLYALYVDRKNRAQAAGTAAAPQPLSPPSAAPATAVMEAPAARAAVLDVLPLLDEPATERARQLVKAPGIALITVGVLALLFNLAVAAYGFVDEFVTPLNSTSNERAAGPYDSPAANGRPNDRGTVVLTIFTLLGFSVASVMAIWGGVNMVRLRGYWLSVARSCAIMPGACFMCVAGLPVGVWALVILFRPEIRATFS